MKKLFVDIESTGLSPKEHDIIQLAYIIEIDDAIKEEGEFLIRPLRFDNISPKALEINGRTIEELKTFPEAKIVYPKIVSLLDKYVDKYNKKDKFRPAGQNVRFDLDFLNEFFIKNSNRYFYSYIDKSQTIDSLPMSRKLTKEGYLDVENHKLGTLCKHFGIFLEAHDALNDIKATRTLIMKLGNLKFNKFMEKYKTKVNEIADKDLSKEAKIDEILRMFYGEFGEK